MSDSPEARLEYGFSMMRAGRWADAVNAMAEVLQAPDTTPELRSKALTAIGVIQEINGFVNKDLMNP